MTLHHRYVGSAVAIDSIAESTPAAVDNEQLRFHDEQSITSLAYVAFLWIVANRLSQMV